MLKSTAPIDGNSELYKKSKKQVLEFSDRITKKLCEKLIQVLPEVYDEKTFSEEASKYIQKMLDVFNNNYCNKLSNTEGGAPAKKVRFVVEASRSRGGPSIKEKIAQAFAVAKAQHQKALSPNLTLISQHTMTDSELIEQSEIQNTGEQQQQQEQVSEEEEQPRLGLTDMRDVPTLPHGNIIKIFTGEADTSEDKLPMGKEYYLSLIKEKELYAEQQKQFEQELRQKQKEEEEDIMESQAKRRKLNDGSHKKIYIESEPVKFDIVSRFFDEDSKNSREKRAYEQVDMQLVSVQLVPEETNPENFNDAPVPVAVKTLAGFDNYASYLSQITQHQTGFPILPPSLQHPMVKCDLQFNEGILKNYSQMLLNAQMFPDM